MKNTLNYFLKTILLLSLFSFFSCEKDLYDDSIQQNSKIILKRVSLKDLESRQNTKVMNAVSLLKNQKIKSNSKIVYDSIFDFHFDDERGIYLENGEKNSYTFPVYRISSNKIENLLFNLNDKGEYDVFLVKYNLLGENLSNLTKTQIEQAEKEYTGLIIDSRITNVHTCIEIESYQLVSDSQWTTQAPNYHYEWVTTSSFCSWSQGNSGGSGNINTGGSSGTNPNGEYPSGGGIGTGGNSGVVLTALVDNHLSNNFFVNLALTPDENTWLNNHFSIRLKIIDYLKDNHSQQDYDYIKGMIGLCIENGGTFVINNDVTAENSINVDSVDEFQSFLNALPNVGNEEEYEIVGTQKTASTKVWFAIPMGGTKFFIKQTMLPNYNIEDVTSNAFGVTLAFSWNQTIYDVTIDQTTKITIVNIFGVLNYNVFFEGIGTVYSSNKHIQIKLNTLTGNIISTTVID